MAFIIAGYGKSSECKESFNAICPYCHRPTVLKIYETSNHVNLYFVPIGKFNKHYYMQCPLCERGVELTKYEKDELVEKLKQKHLKAVDMKPAVPSPTPAQIAGNYAKNSSPQNNQVQRSVSTQLSNKPRISVVTGNMKGTEWELKHGKTVSLGRDFKLANFVFNNYYNFISRIHCTVCYDKKVDKYWVVDSSTNGTYWLNGRRFEKSKRTSVPRGTILYLGDKDCQIKLC